MSSTALDRLETRLQALIEGRLARLIPQPEVRTRLFEALMAALEAEALEGADGALQAPDHFVFLVHNDLAAVLQDEPHLLQDLARMVQKSGEAAGFQFARPPVARVSLDSRADPGQIEVIARFQQDESGETEAIATEDGTPEHLLPNAYLIVEGSQVFTLDHELVNIGRRPDNDLVLDDPRVSREHAQLRAAHGRYILSDLGSTGGTYVNGQRVSQITLYPGDVISLAGVTLVYIQESSDAGETHEIEIHAGDDNHSKTQGSQR